MSTIIRGKPKWLPTTCQECNRSGLRQVIDCEHYDPSLQFALVKRHSECPFQPYQAAWDSGTFECMHCGERAVVWQSDFDFEDYGLEGKGFIHVCQCMACGAMVEYYISCEDEEDDR